MPRDPSSELSFFIDAYTNLTACYEERNIGSAIGEWILQDRARQDFTYVYFNSLRNTVGQSNGHNNHGPVDISAFLPHALLLLVMIVAISHVLHFFLRRLGQSRFVSQMIKKKDRVTVLPFTSIVPQENLHQDICSLIVERTVALAILPFPRKNSMADAEADQKERGLIPIVLEQAQCSVGIMVYHSLTRITQTLQTHQSHIGVLFMGGPDDREAVAIAGHMAYHPYVHLSILRFRISSVIEGIANNMEEIHAREQKLDDEVMVNC
ncbi:cation/H(+) antiporter 15-like protein [Carex littledalei]|uniref:Cation/H(+) antiporter 15-like protein n=1 Tax=Carex littledalei TaxID=544730 RepID=A0A833QG07_9POAL|nr:cation/H(+) antiporter 15-like protein [Carex littledalei]